MKLQNELTAAQEGYKLLERKYNKAKKVIKNYELQMKERDQKYTTIITDMEKYISSLELKLGPAERASLVSALHKSPLFAKISTDPSSLAAGDVSDAEDTDAPSG